jgi:hypothetical protein
LVPKIITTSESAETRNSQRTRKISTDSIKGRDRSSSVNWRRPKTASDSVEDMGPKDIPAPGW